MLLEVLPQALGVIHIKCPVEPGMNREQMLPRPLERQHKRTGILEASRQIRLPMMPGIHQIDISPGWLDSQGPIVGSVKSPAVVVKLRIGDLHQSLIERQQFRGPSRDDRLTGAEASLNLG